MTRNEFLSELRERLSRLPSAERDAALSYYTEYFDDAGPEHEQDVIHELGSPAAVAARIYAEYSVKEVRESPYSPRKGFSAARDVFRAFFAVSFTIPALIFFVVIQIAFFCILLTLWITSIALLIVGVIFFINGVMALFAIPADALILFGATFLLWGTGKFLFVIVEAVQSLFGYISSALLGRKAGGYHGSY